jgi:hypothetical protein
MQFDKHSSPKHFASNNLYPMHLSVIVLTLGNALIVA